MYSVGKTVHNNVVPLYGDEGCPMVQTSGYKVNKY